MVFLLIQTSIQVAIDQMELPANIVIFKPPYYVLAVSFCLELAILTLLVNVYVQETLDKIV